MAKSPSNFPDRPQRLKEVFSFYEPPVYFITFTTWERLAVLHHEAVKDAFCDYAERAAEFSIFVGRYVIMPDHVHLFVQFPRDRDLGRWVKGLKAIMGRAVVGKPKRLWQEGFFDHLIRNQESLVEKWEYVRMNPVRAGLCGTPEEWAHSGEVNEW